MTLFYQLWMKNVFHFNLLKSGRCVEDTKLIILINLYKHLDKLHAHVRIGFADFSPAFNTMQLRLLIKRLCDFKLSHQKLALWILDLFTDRVLRVSVNGRFSDSLIMSTGSPQGCALSPFYSLLCILTAAGAAAIWSNFLTIGLLRCCPFSKAQNQTTGMLSLILFLGVMITSWT